MRVCVCLCVCVCVRVCVCVCVFVCVRERERDGIKAEIKKAQFLAVDEERTDIFWQ